MGVYRTRQLTTETKTLTGTAAALADVTCVGVLIQADPDNTTDMLVGDDAAQVIQLTPGQSFSMTISNTSLIYAKAVSGSPVLNALLTL